MRIWRRGIVEVMWWEGLLFLGSVERRTAERRACLPRVEIKIEVEVLEEAKEVCGFRGGEELCGGRQRGRRGKEGRGGCGIEELEVVECAWRGRRGRLVRGHGWERWPARAHIRGREAAGPHRPGPEVGGMPGLGAGADWLGDAGGRGSGDDKRGDGGLGSG